MCATSPLRPVSSAPVPGLTLADRPDMPADPPGRSVPALRSRGAAQRRTPLRRFALSVLVLSLIWGALTDWRADALVFGVPAVLLGAAIPLLLPDSAPWRLSVRGAVLFALWFAVQSVRGAVDVALRAFAPRMPLCPGFRDHSLRLPQGAPRIMFVNTITLLPGTLSAEIRDDVLRVHMLDTRMALEPALADLEIRIRQLFALPDGPEVSS
ncbi:MAG: Na+/H+ antiporter subunit E [Natronohydrobacter sp.]|nr:Na+/H+ antiporter subunit E [Natronohydrobacter sp.]